MFMLVVLPCFNLGLTVPMYIICYKMKSHLLEKLLALKCTNERKINYTIKTHPTVCNLYSYIK